jgi:dolichyl-phosphate beta-glucosyltransferase
MLKACIVIPFYNESGRIDDDYLNSILSIKKVDYVFVNDGSTDDTLAKLSKFKNKVKIISYENNRGKAEAVRAGLIYASQKGYDLVGYLDSDGAFPYVEVNNFIKFATLKFEQNNDIGVIIASRLRIAGRDINRETSRLIISYVIKFCLFIIFKDKPKDTQSGLKLIRNSSILRDNLVNKFKTRWFFDIELMYYMKSYCRIYELPVDSWSDIKGSNLSMRSIMYVVADLVKLAYKIILIKR